MSRPMQPFKRQVPTTESNGSSVGARAAVRRGASPPRQPIIQHAPGPGDPPVPHLPSLPDDAFLSDVFRRFPDHAAPLTDYVQRLMRGPSPLSVAQRELIGAYVSGLNACVYCHGVHTAIAVSQGIEEQLFAVLVNDLVTAPVEDRMRPVLGLVRTLTLTPAKVRDAEVAAVYAAGWDEQALHDAVSVCGLFNLMNRLVEGLGITATPEQHRAAAKRLGAPAGYV